MALDLAWEPWPMEWIERQIAAARPLGSGLLIVAIIALAARFVSDHYGAPAMLMALLFGIALHFLNEEEKPQPGIAFASKSVLRIGVALLGVRISADMALSLGWETLVMVVAVVLATIAFGMGLARLFGFKDKFGFMSAGSVAICGASAAMAIAAVLPKDERSEERLVFTVVGVTILSTVAMIAYPILAEQIGLSTQVAGVFLGATIHDVAQVVGAGFSISEETGEIATVVKLLRVAMLAPVIIVAAIVVRRVAGAAVEDGERPPLVPLFVVAFFVLLGLNSAGLIPAVVTEAATEASRWALLAAIAAVGIKTSLKDVLDVGGAAIAVLVGQTLFIAVVTLAGLHWL
ncbi:MAG: putative sulfate exporter family transporter [Pseudomonadota bacterium]